MNLAGIEFNKECYFCGETDILVIDLYYLLPSGSPREKVINKMGMCGGVVLCKNCHAKLDALLTGFAAVKQIGVIDEKGVVWISNDPFVNQLRRMITEM